MQKPRIRFVLLLLLWLWAGTIFLVVDLFFNVESFDGLRPRARMYRAMRVAAHEIIGERLQGPWATAYVAPPARLSRGPSPAGLLAALAALTGLDTPGLLAVVQGKDDVRVRIEALRRFAERADAEAGARLADIALDESAMPRLRREAARLLGTTGDEGLPPLVGLVEGDGDGALKRGALEGLARLGTAAAVGRIVEWAEKGSASLRRMATEVLGEVRNPHAVAILDGALRDSAEPSLGIGLCRALANFPEDRAVDALAAAVSDPLRETAVRRAAAEALGFHGQERALDPLLEVAAGANTDLALAARIATQRIRNRLSGTG